MIWGIEKEINIFLQAILEGNLLCLIYAGINIFRGILPHHRFFVSLEDLLFWGFAGGHMFWKIQETCSGNIRWYFVLGLLGGSLITYYFIQKIRGKYIDKFGK